MESLYAELFEAAVVGRRLGELLAADAGQTQARWQAMWTIDHEGRLTVPQVARRLGVSRQGVQRVVDDLVTEGRVRPEPNPDHRTSSLFALTDEGRATLARINRAADAAHRRIGRDVPPSDVEQLRRLLRALTSATRAQYDV